VPSTVCAIYKKSQILQHIGSAWAVDVVGGISQARHKRARPVRGSSSSSSISRPASALIPPSATHNSLRSPPLHPHTRAPTLTIWWCLVEPRIAAAASIVVFCCISNAFSLAVVCCIRNTHFALLPAELFCRACLSAALAAALLSRQADGSFTGLATHRGAVV